MKKVFFVVFYLGISGCVPYQPTLLPSAWDPHFRASFENGDITTKCHWIAETMRAQPNLPAQERNQLLADLRRGGLSSRDLELILENGQLEVRWGTGMTYYGVRCLGGAIVNKSFHPGLGHTWQMQVGNSYLYLRGNGRENNMRVYSWN